MRWLLTVAVLAASCGGATSPAPSMSPTTEAAAATTAPTAAPSEAALTPSSWRSAVAPARAPEGSQWIAIGSSDGTPILAAVYRPPAGAGPTPVAVVLHGDEGLHPKHLGLAQWLTQEGFITLAPCWSRVTVATSLGCGSAPLRDSAAAVVKDVTAVVEAARTLPGARRDRLALVGHSLGAMAAVLNASMGGTIEAVVAISANYGEGIRQRWGTTLPEQVDGLRWPVLMVTGTKDPSFGDAKAYAAAARQRGKSVETLYPEGASHDLPFIQFEWTEDVRGAVIAFLRRLIAR